MTRFFVFVCLLAVFPVVSTKSPIFGPQEVSRVEGDSVSIRCFYPSTSVNRHSRKYWCRQEAKGHCTTLISSGGYVSDDYKGRANLTNFPENGTFVIDVAQLTRNDSGRYKCGLGISSRGLSFDVSLEVSRGPGQINDVRVYTADLGRTVTISCPFKAANLQKKKSVCKMMSQSCVLIADTNNYMNPSYKGRAHISIQGTSQLVFSFVINQVQLSDAGMYVCQAGDDSSADKSNADLQVLKPDPELIYGDLRGSVTIDCDLGPEVKSVPKFLCRLKNEEACDVVINTLKTKAPDFEGRILLTTGNNGRFTVHITGLKKEDAGLYLCGADSDGVPQKGSSTQAWQLFVNEETQIPQSRSVVKGVVGSSVVVSCPYNPKEKDSLKYWCRWEETQNGRCRQLVESNGLVDEQYEGRLVLYEEPGNGVYTVILNQLTTQDAGFYWCLTNGDISWRSVVELKIVEGEPSLKVSKNVTAWLGESFKLPCHFPCKFYSSEKYWCKWSNTGCRTLPSQDQGASQAFVNCSQQSQITSLNLNPVTKEDEGWYWCGVKDGLQYGETAAVYVAVETRVKGTQDARQASAAREEDAIEPRAREDIENKVLLDPRLSAEERAVKKVEDPAGGSGVPADSSSSAAQGRSSKVLVSVLVPVALVLALGVLVIGVLRARHRKNVDRISIRSYRTDISMSDFENSRDFGAHDNTAASPDTQETSLGGKDESAPTIEDTTETKEPKKAKRSSKEEADAAFTAFLLQANNMAAGAQDGPREA
nr:polymeric immunoglobulin receptor [Vicugna pacos]XP_031545749.1 polymeric immunoglobulin receptor [Vicugna pacos]